ncbi:radical SAM family heme chaperone HemW [candidate division KSB1 bacterium]|nr:radical SAM family heme chaperone HemW [candidate division KSB1 bacterium]
MPGAALYIHIPFCEKRCLYCDFYTVAGVAERIPDYVLALQREIALRAEENFWQRQQFETIFFGGGTPSLLSPAQLAEILEACFASFNFSSTPEITLETNPGTIDNTQLARYRTIGVNRLSIGVQSFDENELQLLDRIHSPEQARAAVVGARYAGFKNVSIDLIFALPNQTQKRWRENLQQAVELSPNHISAYNLTIETGTPLDFAIRKGKISPLTEEEEREMYEFTMNFLAQHGYCQYEISNFAQPGYEARHNIKYWDGSAYLGLGASAHSFDGRRRFWNVANLRKYLELTSGGALAEESGEDLTAQQKRFEFAFLGLRQTRGLDLQEFQRRFRMPFERAFNGIVQELEHDGLLERENDFLRLSKEGIFLCDEICARLEG